MQGDAAEQLHVEVTKTEHPRGSLSDHGVGVGQELVQGSALFEPLLEIGGHRAEFVVRHGRVVRREQLYLIRDLAELFDLSIVSVTEYTHRFTS